MNAEAMMLLGYLALGAAVGSVCSCITFALLGIWAHGPDLPTRYAGTALVSFFVALPLFGVGLFLCGTK